MKPPSRNLMLKVILICAVLGGGLVLAELWLDLFSSEVMFKLLTTFAVIGAVAGLLYAIGSDISSEEEQKKDRYLN